ncbi:MAG: hypothetical protein RI883_1118 [Bacteroidota bacterium]|jgi:hypothetical protein
MLKIKQIALKSTILFRFVLDLKLQNEFNRQNH